MAEIPEGRDPLSLKKTTDMLSDGMFAATQDLQRAIISGHPITWFTLMGYDYYKCMYCGTGMYMREYPPSALSYYFGELINNDCGTILRNSESDED